MSYQSVCHSACHALSPIYWFIINLYVTSYQSVGLSSFCMPWVLITLCFTDQDQCEVYTTTEIPTTAIPTTATTGNVTNTTTAYTTVTPTTSGNTTGTTSSGGNTSSTENSNSTLTVPQTTSTGTATTPSMTTG